MGAPMIWCPDCRGEGNLETLISLSVDGDQRWRVERCYRCDGTGLVEEEIKEYEGADDETE